MSSHACVSDESFHSPAILAARRPVNTGYDVIHHTVAEPALNMRPPRSRLAASRAGIYT